MTVGHEPPTPDATTEWAQVGEIVGVFGVRGEVKVRPLSDFPERFAEGATLFLGERHSAYTVSKSRLRPGSHVIGLSGIESANDAERLRGQALYVPTAALGALLPDQFYQHDIIGLRVEHINGARLGIVTDIISVGPNDIYVVKDDAGAEHMLPAVKEFVKQVDVAAGVMRVDPIPGLFDDNAEEVR